MGSGRRSLDRRDKKNSFDDYYSSSRNNNIEENNDLGNNNENNNRYDNNLDDNYERNINFAESNFWDEDEEEFNYGKLIVIIAIIVIAIIAGVLVYKFVINKPVEEQPKEENTVVQESVTMIETVSGYKVLGKIVISNLGIEQYILDSIESNALQSGIGHINNGGSINNYGNFCLAGHNNEKNFERLDELEIGNEFVLVDRKMDETIYQVTEIFEVEPDDLQCLLQDESKIEVTLITCQAGATKRLVIKAQEKNSLASTQNIADTNTVNTEEDI
jgi:sortase A